MNLAQAFQEIQKRKWGFASSRGEGFGDPSSLMTAVGPYNNGVVEVWGMDKDPIIAVEKAILKEKEMAYGNG